MRSGEWEKWFSRRLLYVCHRLACKHYNFQKNYRIGLCLDTLLEGPRRKDEFVNLPFLSNGSSFIYKKHFSKNQQLFISKINQLAYDFSVEKLVLKYDFIFNLSRNSWRWTKTSINATEWFYQYWLVSTD